MKEKLCIKNRHLKFFLIYTAFFAAAAVLVFYPFIKSRISLVWDPDGIAQHYTAFVYFGNYLRDIVKSILAGHLVIPQYDLSIGLGSDILQALHYYVIGDPLNLAAVFVPDKYAAYGYTLLILLRYYLAGLAFCILADYKKMPIHSTVAGAVIYTFTSYTMSLAVRHPSFLNPFIYFPLIILGIEMIFEKKRPYLFIIMIFISAASSFYFFFGISIFTVLYIFVRLFFVYKDNVIKSFFQSLLKFGGCYLLGILMAAIIFVPIVFTFLSSNRGGVEFNFDLLFEKNFYIKFIDSFAGPYSIPKTSLGFTVLGIAGVLMLFADRKKHGFLKLSFVILTIMTLIPVFSKIINGFSYVTNRWTWAYSLLVSYIFAQAFADLKKITFKRSLLIFGGAAAFFLITVSRTGTRKSGYLVSCAVFFIFAFLCFIYSALPYVYGNISKKRIGIFFKGAVAVLAVFAVACNALYIFGWSEQQSVIGFMPFKSANAFVTDNGEKSVKKFQNTETAIERYEKRGVTYANYNNAMLNSTHGVVSYLSLNNTYVNNFQTEMGIVYQNYSIINNSMCDPFIQSIENIRYYADTAQTDYSYNVDSSDIVGYLSIHDTEKKLGNQNVYENKSYIPFGFTYKDVISQADYDALNPADKRNALLSAAVINDTDEFVTARTDELLEKGTYCDYTVEHGDDAEVNSNSVYVKKGSKRASVKLKLEKPANSQLYMMVNNVKYHDTEATQINDDGTFTGIDRNSKNEHDYITAVAQGGRGVTMCVATPFYDYYAGITDLTANLGFCEETETEITIKFSEGLYEFDSIEIVSVPMDDYDERIDALRENTLENLKLETNSISGEITADEAEWLFLSIPYSDNWTAIVDGEETELHRANTAFSAVKLEAGQHTVELRYSNRAVKYSAVLTAAGFLSFAAVITCYEIYNKKRRKNETV